MPATPAVSSCCLLFASSLLGCICSHLKLTLTTSLQQLPRCAGDEPDIIDGKNLRRLALGYKVPIITTVAGARATTAALKGLKSEKMEQVPLQDYFPEVCCSDQGLDRPLHCL